MTTWGGDGREPGPRWTRRKEVSSVRARSLAWPWLLLLGFFALAPLACGPTQHEALVLGRGQDSETLDPANVTEGESTKVVAQIFEGLVEYEDETTSVRPCLATTWEVSPDGLEWTFTLRYGVRFHDGSPLTAEDVVFTIERQRDPNHPSHQGAFVYWNDMFDAVAGVEALSPERVRFRLARPYAPFLSNMAMFTVYIVSAKAFSKAGPEAFRRPVGTGPFRLRSWDRNSRLILERNPDYWRQGAKVERLVFTVVPDNTVRLLQLENGSIHLAEDPNPHDLARVEAKQKLKIQRDPGMNVAYFVMNTRRSPLNDPRLRRALAQAIDRKEIAEKLYYQAAIPAKGMIPPSLWGHHADSAPPAFDPEASRRALRELGYEKGLTLPLWIMDNPRPYMPQPRALAEYLEASFRKVGVELEVEEHEWAAYLEHLAHGRHTLALIGWTGDNGDPDNFLYVLLDKENAREGSASNYSFYQGEEVHQLLVQATQVADRAKRTQLYRRADEVLDREVPVLPLVHTQQVTLLSKRVQGFRRHPTGIPLLRKVGLSP